MAHLVSNEQAEFRTEMAQAEDRLAAGDLRAAERHFGRAHNRGQQVRARHVRSHAGLLRVAWKKRDLGETLGQLALLIGAAIFTMGGLAAARETRSC